MGERADSDDRPTAFSLWCIAEREHPTDRIARRERYLTLMREHGLVIRRGDTEEREGKQ